MVKYMTTERYNFFFTNSLERSLRTITNAFLSSINNKIAHSLKKQKKLLMSRAIQWPFSSIFLFIIRVTLKQASDTRYDGETREKKSRRMESGLSRILHLETQNKSV